MPEQLLGLLARVLGDPAVGAGSGDTGQEQQSAAEHDVGEMSLVFEASRCRVDDVVHGTTIPDSQADADFRTWGVTFPAGPCHGRGSSSVPRFAGWLSIDPRIKSGPPGRAGRSTCADATRGCIESTNCAGIRPTLVPRVVPRHPGGARRIRHSKGWRLSCENARRCAL